MGRFLGNSPHLEGASLRPLLLPMAIGLILGFRKMEMKFFASMPTSLDKKLVTPQVTTKMSKLVDNACLQWNKLNFHF